MNNLLPAPARSFKLVDKGDIIVLKIAVFDEKIKSKKWNNRFVEINKRYIVVDTPTNNGVFHAKDIHGKINVLREYDIQNRMIEYIPCEYSRRVMKRRYWRSERRYI